MSATLLAFPTGMVADFAAPAAAPERSWRDELDEQHRRVRTAFGVLANDIIDPHTD